MSGCAVATIQLVAPLTKENVSMNNGGGGNFGGSGRFDQVEDFPEEEEENDASEAPMPDVVVEVENENEDV